MSEQKICPVCKRRIKKGESISYVPYKVENNEYLFVALHTDCWLSKRGREYIDELRRKTNFYSKIS